MKRLFIIVILIAVLLCGCKGNVSTVGHNREYNIIHITDLAGNCVDCRVSKWYDDEVGIEVQLEDGNSIFCSEGTYILAKDYCPICGKEG